MISGKFFGNPDNRFDTEMRAKALKDAEKKHLQRVDEENRAGIPPYDESIVLDWLQNRTEIPEDMIKGGKIFKVETAKQPEGEYELELKKLQALPKDELQRIINGVETKSREGPISMFSKGDLLNGYAIDTETLRSMQSTRHGGVDYLLMGELSSRPTDSDSKPIVDMSDFAKRIVKGFVYFEVPGFKIPIVKLYLGFERIGYVFPESDVKKIANHLKDERKLLPISSVFEVL